MMRKKAKYGSKVKKAQNGFTNKVKKNEQTGQPIPMRLDKPSPSIDTKNLRKTGAKRTTASINVKNPRKLGTTNPIKAKLKASLKNAAFNSAKRRAIYNQLGWAQDSTSKKLGSRKPSAVETSVTPFGTPKTKTPKTNTSTGTKIKNLTLTSGKRTPSVSSGKSTAKPTAKPTVKSTKKAVRKTKRATKKAVRQNNRAVKRTARKVKRKL